MTTQNPSCGDLRWDDLSGKPASLDDLGASFAAKADLGHGHEILDVSGLQAALDAAGGGAVSWDDVTDKPESFTPAAHDHDSDYAALSHTHDYAATDHDHDGVYATAGHNHDAEYSAIDHTHEGGSSWEFPVGYVLISTVNTNPSTFLGYGTWSAFGAGRVLVGLNASDADFDTAEETGGAKTSSAVVNHTHTVTVTDPGHTHTLPVGATDDTSAPFDRADAGTNASGANASTATGSNTTGITALTANPVGGVASFSIMPPYIVVYFFERTA